MVKWIGLVNYLNIRSDSENQEQGSDFWFEPVAGTEEKGQVWGGRLGFEIPVVPSTEIVAEARGVKKIARMGECLPKKKEKVPVRALRNTKGPSVHCTEVCCVCVWAETCTGLEREDWQQAGTGVTGHGNGRCVYVCVCMCVCVFMCTYRGRPWITTPFSPLQPVSLSSCGLHGLLWAYPLSVQLRRCPQPLRLILTFRSSHRSP